jgi:hypothetical protein
LAHVLAHVLEFGAPASPREDGSPGKLLTDLVRINTVTTNDPHRAVSDKLAKIRYPCEREYN